MNGVRLGRQQAIQRVENMEITKLFGSALCELRVEVRDTDYLDVLQPLQGLQMELANMSRPDDSNSKLHAHSLSCMLRKSTSLGPVRGNLPHGTHVHR